MGFGKRQGGFSGAVPLPPTAPRISIPAPSALAVPQRATPYGDSRAASFPHAVAGAFSTSTSDGGAGEMPPPTPHATRPVSDVDQVKPVIPAIARQSKRAANAAPEPYAFARNGERIRFAGEVIGFVGLMIATLATLYWPADPANASGLRGLIYIPEILDDLIRFTDPRAGIVKSGEAYQRFPSSSYILPVVWIAGLISVIRRRWVLAGLCMGFFAFPWSALGFQFSEAPMFLLVLVAVAGFRALNLSKGVALVAGPLAILFSPLLFGLLAALVFSIVGSPGGGDVSYRTVAFQDLKANEGLPAVERADGPKRIDRVTTLLGLPVQTPQQIAAKAYVMAQEHALRGKPADAAIALNEARGGAYRLTAIDSSRLAAVRSYIAVSGAYGAAARDETAGSYIFWHWVARIALAIGICGGLLGPLADTATTGIVKRVERIRDTQAQLAAAKAEAEQATAPTGFGRAEDMKTIKSISAMEGDVVVARIGRRVLAYLGSGVALVVLAGIAAMIYRTTGLPAASANTAFTQVAMTEAMRSVMGHSGPGFGFNAPYFLGSITLVFALYKMARVLLPFALGGLLIYMLLPQIGKLSYDFRELPQVETAQFSPDLRSQLRSIVANHAPAKVEPIISSALGKYAPVLIEPSTAAYALAQLAYLEGRPDQASGNLRAISPSKELSGNGHRQRIELMNAWANANGHPVEAQAWQVSNLGSLREINDLTFWLAAALAAAGLSSLALGYVANGRRRRIEDLVELRRQSQFMTGAAF